MPRAFLRSFVPFQRRVAEVGHGQLAGAARPEAGLARRRRTSTRATSSGTLSLVDPDNRRPVDFAHAPARLERAAALIGAIENGEARAADVAALLAHWEDGRIKLFVTALGLRFRRRHADVLLDGAYVPLHAAGPAADHLVAFARPHATGTIAAIVPRLVVPLVSDARPLPLGNDAWGSTEILLPATLASEPYRHLVTGERIDSRHESNGCGLAAADVFRTSPVALLWSPAVDRAR